MIADQNLSDILSDIEDVKIENRVMAKTKIQEEAIFLAKSENEKYFVFEGAEALDSYSAAKIIEMSVNFRLSFYRLYDHDFDLPVEKSKVIVYDEKNYYTIITKPKSAVRRRRRPKAVSYTHLFDELSFRRSGQPPV